MNLCGKIISKILSIHRSAIIMAVIFTISITYGYAQVSNAPADTVIVRTDSTVTDTIALKNKQQTDSANKRSKLENDLGIRLSKDALASVVKADATDSAVLDMKHNVFYLYKNAKVNYEDKQLEAGRIKYNQATGIVTAEPLVDSFSVNPSKPSFSQGQEKFTYDTVQYNFKSEKLVGLHVRSKYGEGYMYSEQIKRNPDQSVYAKHSVYTTCSLDEPHFGIVARRIKVVPGHVIATGAANIVVEGVPTPLFLPFGIFPISQTQHSGFVIPTYTIEQRRGIGLMNGGYYFYLNDHADLLTQVNFFSKGSWAVSSISNYINRYHYNGNLSFSYAYTKTGEDYEAGSEITKDFRLIWNHRTDAKAKPGQSFNASIDAGTSSFYSNTSYDPNQILRNQYSSNISFSKNWQGAPLSLTVSARHSQNTANRTINLTLPELSFSVAQINPFQSKRSVGTHWYDKITASYAFHALNSATFIDSTFGFNSLASNKMQNGASHSIPVSASYTVLRFVQMSFGVNYNEYWVTEKLQEQYSNADKKLDSVDTRGFFATRDFNTSMQLSTRIYGTKLYKTGKVKGIRHVLTPNVGFTYRPDFGASPFNYGYYSVRDSVNTQQYLSPYAATSVVGAPAIGKQGSVNFGIGNTLQMKVRTGKDSTATDKIIRLIDGLDIRSAYNIAADSFNWSPLSTSFHTSLLDIININASANFNPYAIDYNTGRLTPHTLSSQGLGLVRFTDANITLGSNFHSKAKNKEDTKSNTEEYNRLMRNSAYGSYLDFNIPWSVNISYSLSLTNSYARFSKKDTLVTSNHNISVSGDFNLTERWKVTVSTGYDLVGHQLTITQLGIFRDMHCWQMSIQTIPFGPNRNYTFTFNAKASVLQDLKLLRRKDYHDVQ